MSERTTRKSSDRLNSLSLCTSEVSPPKISKVAVIETFHGSEGTMTLKTSGPAGNSSNDTRASTSERRPLNISVESANSNKEVISTVRREQAHSKPSFFFQDVGTFFDFYLGRSPLGSLVKIKARFVAEDAQETYNGSKIARYRFEDEGEVEMLVKNWNPTESMHLNKIYSIKGKLQSCKSQVFLTKFFIFSTAQSIGHFFNGFGDQKISPDGVRAFRIAVVYANYQAFLELLLIVSRNLKCRFL